MTKLSQYKILHRTHITQHILNKMGLCDSDICPQCTQVTQKLEILQPGLEKSLSPHMYVLSDITSISRPNKQAKPTFTALAITKKTILVRDKTNWYKFETSYNQQRLLPHLNTPPPKGPAGTQEALRCRSDTPPHSGADHSCARRDPTRNQLTPGTTDSGSTPHFLFGS